jgi:hypothetical protein
MDETSDLETLLKRYDPVGEIGYERLARIEARLIQRADATAQGTLMPPAESSFTDFVVPLWRGALFALMLLGLGAFVGSHTTFFTPEGSVKTAANGGNYTSSKVTVFAMAAPWQDFVGVQGGR